MNIDRLMLSDGVMQVIENLVYPYVKLIELHLSTTYPQRLKSHFWWKISTLIWHRSKMLLNICKREVLCHIYGCMFLCLLYKSM